MNDTVDNTQTGGAPAETGAGVQEVATPTPSITDATPAPAASEPQGAADDMRQAYALDAPEGGKASGEPTEPQEGQTGEPQGQEAPYAVEYPEGFAVDPAFAEIVAPVAKESGLEGKVFGALTARVVGAMQDAEYANMVKTDAELKKDWGADYHANMKVAKATAERLMQGSGLSRQDLAVLQSPKGMRLLYAISQMTGERAAAGTAPAAASESSWAQEVMTNPQHPDYADFRDPSSPRWRQLNERYNRAQV